MRKQMAKPLTTTAAAHRTANPFGNCLYFTANAVARQISKLADEAFAPTGLCPSGALLLSLVTQRPGIAPSEAAEVLHLAPSSVTRFADHLERRELVRREPAGRQMLLHPTAAGKKLLREVEACWQDLHERYSAQVGVKRGQKLAQDLCGVAERLSGERA